MAAVTHLVATSTSANASVYSTKPFNPSADSLLVSFVGASGTVAAAPTLTISSESWSSFTLVTSAVFAAGAHTLYAFVANGLTSSASALKAFFDCTGDAATGSVIQMAEVTGMTRVGGSAVRQIATDPANASSTSPVCTWAASTLSANPCIAAVGYISSLPGVNPMTSWTQRSDVGYTTPSLSVEYMSRDSGYVSTTVSTATPVSSANAMIALELDTSVLATFLRIVYPARMDGLGSGGIFTVNRVY